MKNHRNLKFANIILDKVKNPIIITDTNVMIVWTNTAFESLTGFSPQEAIGKNPGELLQGPETSKESRQMMRNAIANRQTFHIELVNYKKSKEPYWVHIDCSPLFENENHIGFIAVESDITEKRNREKKLIKKNNFLQDILQDMSHEMRGPVASILGLNAAIKVTDTMEEKLEMFDLLNQCALELDKIFLQLNIKIYKESKNE
ncbi:MAG TPA: PAS domain-containing protein [Sphingobacteriaceae bacterium]